MYGEMLREGWTSEEKKRSYYDYIYTESERLSRLIDNVLQLARMRRNDLRIKLQATTVSELLDTIQSKCATQIEAAGFELEIGHDGECNGSVIDIDRDAFTQIIINLVDNAIKFSARADKRRVEIDCKRLRQQRIQFSVRDFGPGIAPNQMKKIFHLFYRSESELTRETVGTGIGLALVEQLCREMGGEIDVINREPGSEFTLTFHTSTTSQVK
ncbi:sensor histidine kinase [Candidatus Reidiella endopervernicosa]|uniref:sensor histidine kinase n=1 Tax=Candidatus Reidiella endopervernicosa TaxID=2738883 RepID=UPI001EF12EFB|nr:HAMP domain-containing sensor histidine kinase [Candidatus Reidiella endopervernicosa]